MFIPQEIIRKKRDGKTLTELDIIAFVEGITNNTVVNEQISALAMAVFLNGFSKEETLALTMAMLNSGDKLDWQKGSEFGCELNGPVIDKHSTGGVGDTVSLMLGPIWAACGCFVPMISGRGLGHTGGTLDKFDSIPGYKTNPNNELLIKTVAKAGVAIIGQTANLAPADKRFYSVRDVTSTVESIPLITASILSKKLAEGLDTLVMDVKAGSGAFMPTYDMSVQLAKSISSVANSAGVKTVSLLTDMNEPLANCAGNAVEMREAVEYLLGRKDKRLHDVTVELCAYGLQTAGVCADINSARAKVNQVIDNGLAAEHFSKMVSMLGGANDFVENYDKYLAKANYTKEIWADEQMLESSNTVTKINTRDVGMAVVELGGGRKNPTDPIDYSVGLTDIIRIGEDAKQKPLAVVHYRDEADFEKVSEFVKKSFTCSDEKPQKNKIIYDVI